MRHFVVYLFAITEFDGPLDDRANVDHYIHFCYALRAATVNYTCECVCGYVVPEIRERPVNSVYPDTVIQLKSQRTRLTPGTQTADNT